ncbi:MAG: L,D-peptidoglycan transpeptidase YkuD (ErfK/YbiS/YcfS/YnhG family) [Planctomycetota bacterium]|jgi:L,D-peptidoglycan transpeptidase YkuD (ErfK/YbiS/YcfS/YnhG family)
MHMKRLSCLGLLALLAACSVQPERALLALDLPAATTQVILSTTSSWHDPTAIVRCFERSGEGWQVVELGLTANGLPADGVSASIGRSGLGWGLGMHVDGDGPRKREGDGRAPAGIFSLGTAFGYAAIAPAGMALPYRQSTDRDYFVDASDSPVYNQWQSIPIAEPNTPKARWNSCERMRRDDAVYELGMVVNHNTSDAVPGRGSAIFLHVWAGEGESTSGCTAMSLANLRRVMMWLRSDAQPLLVQVPSDQLSHLHRMR